MYTVHAWNEDWLNHLKSLIRDQTVTELLQQCLCYTVAYLGRGTDDVPSPFCLNAKFFLKKMAHSEPK